MKKNTSYNTSYTKKIALVIVAIVAVTYNRTTVLSLISCVRAKYTAKTTSHTTATTPIIKEITTEKELNECLQDTMPVVIKFHADWCGGCQYVDTFFPSLAESFKGVVHFYSINADNQEVMKLVQKSKLTKESVAYLPTILLIKDGITQEEISGVKEYEYLQPKISEVFKLQ